MLTLMLNAYFVIIVTFIDGPNISTYLPNGLKIEFDIDYIVNIIHYKNKLTTLLRLIIILLKINSR